MFELSEIGQRTGFSDSWGWYQYIYGSVCRFRVLTSRTDANLIIKVNQVTGSAPLRLYVMNKNKFEFPIQQVDIGVTDKNKVFNVSGTYFEFQLYV